MRVLLAFRFLFVITLPIAAVGLAQQPSFVKAAMNLQQHVDSEGGERFCEIGKTPFGRGLVATEDLKPGDVALRIPLSCALVEPDVDNDKDSWTGRLANQLLDQKHSFYTCALPVPPSTPARGDWPEQLLDEFQNSAFCKEIDAALDWRYKKWESHCGSYQERQEFLDKLDLVCSRTIRIGKKLMLVPLLDMANHASRQQGGGFYKLDGSNVCLVAGERGIRKGNEVTLDYGTRTNEDWLIHYGFLPDRNLAETILLPSSKRIVSWDDVGKADISVERECLTLLQESDTTLEEDLGLLQSNADDDFRLSLAINYRLSRKILLSAIAGQKAASASTSAFSSFAFSEVN